MEQDCSGPEDCSYVGDSLQPQVAGLVVAADTTEAPLPLQMSWGSSILTYTGAGPGSFFLLSLAWKSTASCKAMFILVQRGVIAFIRFSQASMTKGTWNACINTRAFSAFCPQFFYLDPLLGLPESLFGFSYHQNTYLYSDLYSEL